MEKYSDVGYENYRGTSFISRHILLAIASSFIAGFLVFLYWMYQPELEALFRGDDTDAPFLPVVGNEVREESGFLGMMNDSLLRVSLKDSDADGIIDAEDTDDDNDGVVDELDFDDNNNGTPDKNDAETILLSLLQNNKTSISENQTTNTFTYPSSNNQGSLFTQNYYSGVGGNSATRTLLEGSGIIVSSDENTITIASTLGQNVNLENEITDKLHVKNISHKESVTAGSNKIILSGSPEGSVLKGFTIDINESALLLGAASIAPDSLDFTEFQDQLDLDASTDILADGSELLSITNTGTGSSFRVNDEASDATPFVIDADGRVGIGTATPNASNLLTVERTSTITSGSANGINSGVTVNPGSASTAFHQAGDFYVSSNSGLAFNLSTLWGSHHAVYHQGSGTVTDATGMYAEIENYGNGTITNSNAITAYLYNEDTVTNQKFLNVANIANTGTITNTYGLYIGDITAGTQTNQAYGLYVSDANARNYFAGNVGIGTATPDSNVSLDIVKTITGTMPGGFPSYTGTRSTLTFNPDNNSQTFVTSGEFYSSTQSGNTRNLRSLKGLTAQAGHAGSGTADFVWGTEGYAYNESTGTVTLGVGASGFVSNHGGGTITSAIGVLAEVSRSDGSMTNATGLSAAVYNGAASGTLSVLKAIEIAGISNANTITNTYGLYIDDLTTGTQTNQAYSIYASDANTRNYFAGNVGIGTTTTTNARLNVQTDAASSYAGYFFNDGNNANRYGIKIQAGADDASGTTYYLDAYDGDGGQVGYIANTAGTFAVTDVSDRRTKTNITDTAFTNARGTLNSIRVVDFNRKADPDGPRITGFIAQEVEAVYPYAVTEGRTGYLGVQKDAFIPLLIKAVQEQDNILTDQGESLTEVAVVALPDLNEQLATTLNRIEDIETDVEDLQNQITALEGSDGEESNEEGIFENGLSITGLGIFNDIVSFMDGVVFNSTVQMKNGLVATGVSLFEGVLVQNADAAGHVTVDEGEQEKEVRFNNPYPQAPVVTLTPNQESEINYYVSDVTDEGFVVHINEDAPEDLQFSWHAVVTALED